MLSRFTVLVIFLLLSMLRASQGQTPDIQTAVLHETGAKTAQISTDDLRKVLADKSAMVFDVRPASEFATSHIPGAINVAQKPGTSKALYISDVAEIGRAVGGDKSKAIIVYCNGPFCGKSKRLSEELLAAGFTHVRRYQLGIPVWRALGGVTQIEPEGARYVMQSDHTSVWLDTRSPDRAQPALAGAKRISVEVARGGKDNADMQRAKNDGTLPIDDHNTRIIVFGDDQQAVKAVADSIAKEAFHNIAFFAGTTSELMAATK
jgi:rhodanese-related sulfurtransferase